MGFVLLGVALVVLRLGGWVKFHNDDLWAWVIVLAPFGLAVLWWAWSDATGRTQRDVMRTLDQRREARRQQQMEALGQSRPSAKRKR
ncbi:TIGR04438 family Trp-rich protein [Roseateles sp. BYS87W]|uniref:TIGR04438 family Trp-rich protein n=1 Tax=Pelomonas baiyunensis TaxID=3299026 RepID=A0ABW7GY44_9BURK